MSEIAGNGTGKWTRYTARILALTWACLWLVVGLLSGAGAGTKGFMANAPNALPGLLFVASALLAWLRPRVGGTVLLVEGLLLGIGYPLFMHARFPVTTLLLVLAFISIPPFVAGLLLLLARPGARAGKAPGTGSAAPGKEAL